jgi:hypothetical protein
VPLSHLKKVQLNHLKNKIPTEKQFFEKTGKKKYHVKTQPICKSANKKNTQGYKKSLNNKIPLGNKITVNNKITNKQKQIPLGNKITMSESRPIRNFPKTKDQLKNKIVQHHNKTHKNAF